MQPSLSLHTALLATVAAIAMAACGQADEPSPGARLDAAIATTAERTEAARAELGTAVDAAKADAQVAADRAAAAIDKATGDAGLALTDAGITTSITAELAKDPALSALKINVDTSAGKVVLRGTAPSADARDRAARLAMGVRGVTAVDNQLSVRS